MQDAEMFYFKQGLSIKINQTEACKTIGLSNTSMSQILKGKVACRKVVAYCITKYIDENAEIEDYFTRKEN